jgi:hypothetical protein
MVLSAPAYAPFATDRRLVALDDGDAQLALRTQQYRLQSWLLRSIADDRMVASTARVNRPAMGRTSS